MKLGKFLAAAVALILTQAAFAQVSVRSASYGRNCGVVMGYATNHVSKQCDNKYVCNYAINVNDLGDPAPGCAKTFEVSYACVWNGVAKTMTVQPEANGKTLRLDCMYQNPAYGLTVQSASYGLNVGAPYGNATTFVSDVCKGKSRCQYYISVGELGDPVPGYTKDFRVNYTCGDGVNRQAFSSAEANGKVVDLICY